MIWIESVEPETPEDCDIKDVADGITKGLLDSGLLDVSSFENKTNILIERVQKVIICNLKNSGIVQGKEI